MGGTGPRGPASGAPRNVRRSTKWSREASLSSGGRTADKQEDRPEQARSGELRLGRAGKVEQLLQGWSARPSREGDLEAENQGGGAVWGGDGTCEGPGPGQLSEVDGRDPEAGAGTAPEPDRPRPAGPPGPRGAAHASGATRLDYYRGELSCFWVNPDFHNPGGPSLGVGGVGYMQFACGSL